MRTRQGNLLQALRAVHAFLETNDAFLGDINRTGTRRQLDAYIIELSQHIANQAGSQLVAMGLTQKQYMLRQTLLRDHMSLISRIAQTTLPPSIEVAPFRMPRGRPTVERLASLANGMAKAAAPFAPEFISAGAPTTFVSGLTGAANAMVDAMSKRSEVVGSGRGATTGLQATLSAARRIVRVLDAMVRSALQDNPPLLANWDLVKRVRVTPNRLKSAATISTPIAPTTEGPQPFDAANQ